MLKISLYIFFICHSLYLQIVKGLQVKTYWGTNKCGVRDEYHDPATLTNYDPAEVYEKNRQNDEEPAKINRTSRAGVNSFKEEIQKKMNSTRQYLRSDGNQNKKILDEGCEHIIIDADYSFSSEDMDIVFQVSLFVF
jgi:hypothetical protein